MLVVYMKLSVPYVKQINTHSCYIASIEMVLTYSGTKINQKTLYEKSKVLDPENKNRILGCFEPDIMLALKNKGLKMDWWINYKSKMKLSKLWQGYFKKYNSRLEHAKRLGLIKEHKNANIFLIKQFLKKNIPVMIEVQTNAWYNFNKYDKNETHNVVVLGYEKGKFLVNDPFMPYLGKNGKDILISEKHLKISWEAPPYYRNSMSILRTR